MRLPKLKKIFFKITKYLTILIAVLFSTFIICNYLFPIPKNNRHFSTVVLADDGRPLRAFADENGVWRYPATLNDVSPRYIEALINYEDRWFYHHPGVNPLAMIRATWQMIRYRKLISGGSTITMQVARLLDPHERNLPGKLKQMFRALQLEWKYSKDEILTIYLNIAPFGGPIEGVQAASYSYLGKPAKQLTHSEAALLAVLPQSPTRFRPDLHPERATRARNKVIARMGEFKIWSQETVKDAFMEKVPTTFFPKPIISPLLSRRLTQENPSKRAIRTYINYELQRNLEILLQNYINQFPAKTSAAIIVVDNDKYQVKAYLGSADFGNDTRFGHVDMVSSERSPGSTLKPFLYAFAMDEGMIHSESLMADVPFNFNGYRPLNFSNTINGPISVSEALQKSLNIPSVFLLNKLTPRIFLDRMLNSGLKLNIPGDNRDNLAIILGGCSTNLESLVSSYTMFGNKGVAGKLRYTKNSEKIEKKTISAETAWIIKDILRKGNRTGERDSGILKRGNRSVAWKTGTSYGFRDAWAIGVTDDYTIGVWVGRPDNTPSPGQYGAVSAAPLLFNIVDSQLLAPSWKPPQKRPENVTEKEICWPLGTTYKESEKHLCHQKRKAWVINDVTPPTLTTDNKNYSLKANIWINPETGKRVDRTCGIEKIIKKEVALWPSPLRPWINTHTFASQQIPEYDPSCKKISSGNYSSIKIHGLQPDSILKKANNSNIPVSATLHAAGAEDEVFWIINGELAFKTQKDSRHVYHFNKKGKNHIAIVDSFGNYDSINIDVAD